jgi:hypothetical protein
MFWPDTRDAPETASVFAEFSKTEKYTTAESAEFACCVNPAVRTERRSMERGLEIMAKRIQQNRAGEGVC